ncbi:MAG: mechanosensitive ion channel family protein [Colwellia sp.]|nr:mechanosensitive ion channel family protein [Colwellia sp.]
MKNGYLLFTCIFLLLFSQNTLGQSTQTPEVSLKDILENQSIQDDKSQLVDSSATNNIPEDEFDRGQPRSSLQGFINAVSAHDYALATQYLDYRNISPSTLDLGKEELARKLSIVLNRTLWIDLNNISDERRGNLTDSLPSYRELIGRIETKKGSINLYLQHIPRSTDKVKIWKISNATVNKIPMLSDEFSYTPLGEWLSKKLPANIILGVMLWQWCYFVLLFTLLFIAAKVVTLLISYLVKYLYPKVNKNTLTFIKNPLALLVAVFLLRNFSSEANQTLATKAVSEGATLYIIAWLWVFFHFVELMKTILADKFIAQDKPLAVYLLRPAGTVVKSLVVIIATLVWFENLGFSASTLLAGLGIGGLAIALAAQKTVENIIAAITLYTSAPVRIGDFCRFGKQFGVVEEIGLRSTRVRTLDRTVVYVANAQFIDMQIENFSEREKIAFRPKLKLATTCKKSDIENFIAALQTELESLPCVADEPLRIHFRGFSSWALNIEILAYIKTTDFEEYLAFSEGINLSILALLESNNCVLAGLSDFKHFD